MATPSSRYRHKVIGGRFVVRTPYLDRAAGVYRVKIRDTVTGDQFDRTTRAAKLDDAERVALAIAEALAQEAFTGGQATAIPFAEAFEEWLEELSLADSTRRYYESNLEVFKPHFRRNVRDVKREDIKAFVRRRRKEVSGATIAKQLVQLRAFFRWAIDENYHREDPTIRVKAPRSTVRKGIALELEEARALLRACREDEIRTVTPDRRRRKKWKQTFRPAPYLYLFVLIALRTGLRKANVLALRWSQIDLEKRRITIPAAEMKMREPHVVPIHRELEEALRAALAGADKVPTYVLGERRAEIRKAFLGAVRRSGVPSDLRIHDLRHTCSTWCQLELPFLVAETLMARKVAAVGGRYFHPRFDDLLEAIDRLPWIETTSEETSKRRAQG